MSNEFCVLIDSVYNQTLFFFYPNKTSEQFIEWWRNLESISEFLFEPETKEDLVNVRTEEDYVEWILAIDTSLLLHINTDGDSFLVLPDGTEIYHKGFDGNYLELQPGDETVRLGQEGLIVSGHLGEDFNFIPDSEMIDIDEDLSELAYWEWRSEA